MNIVFATNATETASFMVKSELRVFLPGGGQLRHGSAAPRSTIS